MTRLLRRLLKEDYLYFVKEAMLRRHWNNTTLSRHTGYSKAHIGNLLAGNGSDDALAAACTALNIDIRNLMKGFNDNHNTTKQVDHDQVNEGSTGDTAPSPVSRLAG